MNIATQLDISQALRDVLESLWPTSLADPAPLTVSEWKALADAGWLGFLLDLPEEASSNESAAVQLQALAEEFGRTLPPGPLVSTVGYVITMLRAVGSESARAMENDVRSGLIVAAEVPDETSLESAPLLRVSTSGRIDGIATVPIASLASQLLLRCGTEAGTMLLRIPMDLTELTVRESKGLQIGQVLATVEIHDLLVEADWVLSSDEVAIEHAHRIGFASFHTLAAGIAVGGAEEALRRTVEYANERVQFGSRIGEFQAIRHQIADMRTQVDVARAAALATWENHLLAPDSLDAARMARIVADEAFRNVVNSAIQIHGGIGFTWEQGIHRWYRAALFQSLTQGDLDASAKILGSWSYAN